MFKMASKFVVGLGLVSALSGCEKEDILPPTVPSGEPEKTEIQYDTIALTMPRYIGSLNFYHSEETQEAGFSFMPARLTHSEHRLQFEGEFCEDAYVSSHMSITFDLGNIKRLANMGKGHLFRANVNLTSKSSEGNVLAGVEDQTVVINEFDATSVKNDSLGNFSTEAVMLLNNENADNLQQVEDKIRELFEFLNDNTEDFQAQYAPLKNQVPNEISDSQVIKSDDWQHDGYLTLEFKTHSNVSTIKGNVNSEENPHGKSGSLTYIPY